MDAADSKRTFRVTHPFHPLSERTFELVSVNQTWGEHRAFYVDDHGDLAAMPVNCTDIGEPDPYVVLARGRSYCRPHDLLRLCDLINEIDERRR